MPQRFFENGNETQRPQRTQGRRDDVAAIFSASSKRLSHKGLSAAELRSAATKDYAAASRRLGGSAPQPPPAFLGHGSDVPSVYATSPPPGLSRWSDDSALQSSDAASRRPRRACLGGANDCPLGIPGGQSWAPPRQARWGPDVSTFRRVVQNHASTGTSPAGSKKSSRDARKQNVSSTKSTKDCQR